MNLPYLEIGDCIFRIGKFSNHSKKNNSYLVIKQEFASIIDPGPFSHFPDTFSIVKSLIYDKPLQYCICYNSDPDICSSIPLWEKEYPYMTVLSASFCAELIGCYNTNLKCLSVNEKCAEYIQLPGKYMIELFSLPEIGLLTFDHVSKILFSGKLFCSKNESAYEDRQQYIEEVTSNNKKILKNSAALSIETIQKKLTSLDVTMIAPTYGPLINDSLTVTDSIKKSIYQNNSTTHQSLNVSNKSLQTDKTLRHRNLNVDDLLPPDVKKRIPSKNLSIHKPVEPEMNVDTDEKKNSEILLNRKCTEQTSGEQKNSAELIKGMDNQNENETHHTD
ncbi:MAG: hypothetical protein PVI26_10515 [Chitinispirillia bacterium]|jgi:hypothetical protein